MYDADRGGPAFVAVAGGQRSATRSRPGRRRVVRGNRRGATLALFALLVIPLLTVAAMAIDASQWQVGANQLQVAADAAALAAARAAQAHPATASACAGTTTSPDTYAQNSANANVAFGAAVSVACGDVEPYSYSPTTGNATAATWTTYNAIKVTARGTGRRILSSAVRSSGPSVNRSAVAWIASLSGA